ncbi:hypothetical protein EVAR_82279_1 [Eumeta japonica]|uniref:Uncharacterized protein n=1 Tax=Eumeta variegata TaxID=151549 RepID=A0A4C1W172_EUMVA|nr:hypothetical protein EVAR_82279_1 [Eumeta japonica]
MVVKATITAPRTAPRAQNRVRLQDAVAAPARGRPRCPTRGPRAPACGPRPTLRSSSLSFSSDEFIQAQQQLARWASEDAVPGAAAAAERDYFPSPPGSSSSDAATVAARPPAPDSDDTALSSSSTVTGEGARFPEYKH